MTEIIKNKLFFPVVALAIVGVVGATYTITHSGPTTANAQTAVANSTTQAGPDKETKDDSSIEPSHTVQQADTNENDKADNSSTNEKEDNK